MHGPELLQLERKCILRRALSQRLMAESPDIRLELVLAEMKEAGVEVQDKTTRYELRLHGRVASATCSREGAVRNWITATLREFDISLRELPSAR